MTDSASSKSTDDEPEGSRVGTATSEESAGRRDSGTSKPKPRGSARLKRVRRAFVQPRERSSDECWEDIRIRLKELWDTKQHYLIAQALGMSNSSVSDVVSNSRKRPTRLGRDKFPRLDEAFPTPAGQPKWTELYAAYQRALTRETQRRTTWRPFRPGREVIDDAPPRRRWLMLALPAALAAALAVGVTVSVRRASTPSRQSAPVYDFEGSVEGWGEQVLPGAHRVGAGVALYCGDTGAVRWSGRCSLSFTPSRAARDAWVTVMRDASDRVVTAHVIVPAGATCVGVAAARRCSTAKIVVLDRNGRLHEMNDYVELGAEWSSLRLDGRDTSWPQPWRELGLHFYLVPGFKGSIHIDAVGID